MTLSADEGQFPPESEIEAPERERPMAAGELESESEPESKMEALDRERAMATTEPNRENERPSEPHREEVHSRPADMAGFQSRFETVQSEFFDEPRHAVEKAASLVEEAVDLMMRTLQRDLEHVRSELGDGNDTERLRIALRRYRDVLESLDKGGTRPIG